jgi:hypothetical protein
VDLQVKKTIVELQNLEKLLQCEDIDLRLVKEYRDAVEYIRTAAATLQQLRECQFGGLDGGELLSTLATDRIRRTLNLCVEVAADLDAGRLKTESKGVDELYRAIEDLHDRIRQAGKARVAIR